MKRAALVLLSTLLSCPPVMAQSTPRFEGFAGYSLERISPCGSQGDPQQSACGDGNLPSPVATFNGWDTSFTAFFYKYLGATADFSSHSGTITLTDFPSSWSRRNYLFGPVVAAPTKYFTSFAHALFGFDTTKPGRGTKFARAAGAGLDVNAARHLAVRVGQIDYEWVNPPTRQANLPALTGFRYSAGLVIKF